ncbi:ferroxidase [Methanocaldococcus villosus KIN24-T80]|uniref:Ferroxidase n=1 Tax=Methanocaldococcus villosus KIN24-T80 TaxID=1069083 RepID=N6VQM4_9EURY|nr:ferritin [Methanocaldococcus villosus]ENN96195.1 ferroxidase [Methanocaldococcus villosus KIN24-T80]
MIDKDIEKAINKQINSEFYSAYLYLSMAAYADSIGLKGFANWLMVQFKEETDHALKLYNYLLDRGGRVILDKIDKPKSEWNSILEVFEDGLKHEEEVTKSINELMDLAVAKKDYATINILQWFIDEQVEEEKSFGEILNKLKLIGNDKKALLMLDKDLAQRVYTPPTNEK